MNRYAEAYIEYFRKNGNQYGAYDWYKLVGDCAAFAGQQLSAADVAALDAHRDYVGRMETDCPEYKPEQSPLAMRGKELEREIDAGLAEIRTELDERWQKYRQEFSVRDTTRRLTGLAEDLYREGLTGNAITILETGIRKGEQHGVNRQEHLEGAKTLLAEWRKGVA